MNKDFGIQLPQISYQELCMRTLQARDLFEDARREATLWAMQEAYRLLREAYPGAAWLVMNACLGQDEACWIQEIRDCAGVSVWRAGDAARADDELPRRLNAPLAWDFAAIHEQANCLLNDVVTWNSSGRELPGWRELKRKSGIYVADMNAIEEALATDIIAVRPEVTAVVRAALTHMPYDTAIATKRYAQLLVDGRPSPQGPRDVIGEPVSCPVDGSALSHHPKQPKHFAPETWDDAIAVVTALGSGAVRNLNTGEVRDSPDPADVRFSVTTQDLMNAGITLEEFGGAFSGARTAALAIVQAD